MNHNNTNINLLEDDTITHLMRSQYYISEFYDIREELCINAASTNKKLFGETKDKGLSVIITQQCLRDLDDDELRERISCMVRLVEENVVLVENFWIQEEREEREELSYNAQRYSLFISEFTKETYENDYGLYSLSSYLHGSKGLSNEKGLILLKNILSKVDYLHQSFGIAHLNLSSCNVYVNLLTFEIFLGPIKLLNNAYDELWYSSPEISLGCPSELIQTGVKNDVWTIGCLIAEIFFVATPLFQSYGTKDKLRRVIEILGFPKYSDVSFLSIKEYNSLYKKYCDGIKETTPYLAKLVDCDDRDPFGLEIFSIMESCLQYSPKTRPGIKEILTKVNLIRSHTRTHKQCSHMDTIAHHIESKSHRGLLKEDTFTPLQVTNPPHKKKYDKDHNPEKDHKDDYQNLNEQLDSLMDYIRNLDSNQKTKYYY